MASSWVPLDFSALILNLWGIGPEFSMDLENKCQLDLSQNRLRWCDRSKSEWFSMHEEMFPNSTHLGEGVAATF